MISIDSLKLEKARGLHANLLKTEEVKVGGGSVGTQTVIVALTDTGGMYPSFITTLYKPIHATGMVIQANFQISPFDRLCWRMVDQATGGLLVDPSTVEANYVEVVTQVEIIDIYLDLIVGGKAGTGEHGVAAINIRQVNY